MHSGTAVRPLFGENLTAELIGQLEQRGWAHAADIIDPDLIADLRREAKALSQAGAMQTARVGRGEHTRQASRIRRTAIAWLDGATPAQRAFLDGCEALRVEINRALYLGLFDFEAHYAAYPPGGFYARHLDAFSAPIKGSSAAAHFGARAERARVVSMVAYLNEDWQEADGGALALWEQTPRTQQGDADLKALDDIAPDAVLEPTAGSFVLMLSEMIPHEVRPAYAPRYAIAGWWRVNTSLGGMVDPGR